MRHKAWMSTGSYYVGLLALTTLPLRAGGDWAGWLPYIAAIYVLGSVTISVGYHRLFCHGSFKTSPFWHWFFSVSGVAFMYSSPLQWAVTHATHHRHADTDRDPHPESTRMHALLFKSYRNVPLDTWKSRRLIRQGSMHGFVDQYYLAIYFAIVAAIAMLSMDFLLYAYLPALGLAHFIGALHNMFSHFGGGPRDMAVMEYLLPASGEWLHATHHNRPGRWNFRAKPWHFDLGALVIRAIRSSK